jgi:23S rRNA (cytidine1920-2'-O)/16S rRNA (cytidine1409-2'-O)-methyltransferase
MPKKVRVDLLLVESGLVDSRSLAQRLVMAGQVRANGQLVDKPSSKVDETVDLTIDHGPRFVSRGGDKLEAAFEVFDLDVANKVCADVGASTGGFTDCLLQHDAAKVYAIDVGQGILHWNLRNDPRVVVMESTNARFVEQLPELVDFITIDASFISLKILLPVVREWLAARSGSDVLALIKPQFEAGRKEVARGKGVVRNPEIHRRVLLDVLTFTQQEGFQIKGLARSPVLGPKGNVEFLGWLSYSDRSDPAQILVDQLVSMVLDRE